MTLTLTPLLTLAIALGPAFLLAPFTAVPVAALVVAGWKEFGR